MWENTIFINLYKAQVQVDRDLNVKPNILNLLEEEVGNSLKCIGTGENFLNRTPMAHALRSTIDKWDLMKLKAKDTVNRTKWHIG